MHNSREGVWEGRVAGACCWWDEREAVESTGIGSEGGAIEVVKGSKSSSKRRSKWWAGGGSWGGVMAGAGGERGFASGSA